MSLETFFTFQSDVIYTNFNIFLRLMIIYINILRYVYITFMISLVYINKELIYVTIIINSLLDKVIYFSNNFEEG